jgi:hypothetical protein
MNVADSSKLSPEEMRIIRAYRKFDDDSQVFWLEGMEACARKPECGLRAKKSELRLVAGGAA